MPTGRPLAAPAGRVPQPQLPVCLCSASASTAMWVLPSLLWALLPSLGARERVKFDFAWKHALVPHGAPAGPPPPPTGPPMPCPADGWPANASGLDCRGGVRHGVPGITAQICAAACCNDPNCARWQFTNASGVGEDQRCMLSVRSSGLGPGQCTNDTAVVGGSRPARLPEPAPGTPPGPSASDHPAEAQPSFDDRSWAAVDVPHDMNIGQAPSLADCPYGCGGRSFLVRHSGWYRKKFRIPPGWEGAHITVEFEGVFRHAMIYLNGRYLQNHTSGYTSFEVVLPASSLAAAAAGEDHLLAVYADARSGEGNGPRSAGHNAPPLF